MQATATETRLPETEQSKGLQRINVRVPAALKKKIDHATIERDTSITAAVIEAMESWLSKHAA